MFLQKKILVTCIDAPFIGGAGTNAYNLIKLLRNILKYKVIGLFINSNNSWNIDPHNIGDIFYYNPNRTNLNEVKAKINKVLNGDPDIIFAKNYISIFISKKIYAKTTLIFLPSGSSYYTHYCSIKETIPISELIKKLEHSEIKLNDIITDKGKWPCFPNSCPIGCDCEIRAIQIADKIIPNSQITENLLNLMCKNIKMGENYVVDKILKYIPISGLYDLTYFNKIKKNIDFFLRKYDIIFVCFNWKRKLKNLELVGKIINSAKLKNYLGLIIGNNCETIKSEYSNFMMFKAIDNKALFEFLCNSKCLVCTSYYDSYPNVITEANLSGCNIISSQNIGQFNLIPKELLINDFYNIDEWIEKIMIGTNTKFQALKFNQFDVLNKLDEFIKK